MVKQEHYTFGDTDLAAYRLQVLARVFEPGSTQLMKELAHVEGGLGLDLGCGPGHTTRLLAQSVALERVIGLDQSPRLLEQAAREQRDPRLSFALCDVTVAPFPAPPADVLYARFLLTHLRDPRLAVRTWSEAALPAARLLLEETAFMSTDNETILRYYGLVERMQAHYGQRMYVGRELESLAASSEWLVERAEIRVFPLPAVDMARLHFLNLGTWSRDSFAQSNYATEELSELSAGLERIASGEVSEKPISCGVGQVVLRRR